jgi:hypothetical protein
MSMMVESESAGSLSSALLHQALLEDLFIQTFQDLALTLWPFPRSFSSGVDNAPRGRNARMGSDFP